MKPKVRLYLSIPQFRMALPALNAAGLPRTQRLSLDADEIERLWEAWKDVAPRATDHLGKFRTWDVGCDRIRKALAEARAAVVQAGKVA